MKKIYYGFFILLFLLFPANLVNAKEVNINNALSESKIQKDIKKHMIENYGKDYELKLYNNQMAVETATLIEKNFNHNEYNEPVYPKYLGGLYINANNKLVIELVKKNIPVSTSKEFKIYNSISNISQNVMYKYVDYSYSQLQEIYDKILNNYLGKDNQIVGIYINTSLNRVVVELNELSESNIEKFKKNIIDSPMIIFEENNEFSEISNINPGEHFYYSDVGNCSYGYRAKTPSGEVGIVTAGHCFKKKGNVLKNIGEVTKYENDSALDMAFIQTYSNVTPTNLISIPAIALNINLNTTINTSIVVGQAVSKFGYKTGLTYGVVKATNYSFVNKEKQRRDYLVRTTMAADEGDSGGIAFQPSTNLGTNITLGIMEAKSKDGKQSLVTKATKIYEKFALSRY